MRKSLWITVTVLFVTFGASSAYADSLIDYTIDFKVGIVSEGIEFPPPPTGSFVFDTTTNEFTSFTVDWIQGGIDFGFTFDLTACANGVGEPLNPDLVCTLTSDGLTTYKALTAPNVSWSAFSAFSCSAPECVLAYRSFAIDGIAEKRLPSPSDENVNDELDEDGTLTVVAPEPGTFVLMLLGMGFLLVVPKCLARGLQQTN